MTLILNNEQINSIISIGECISAMEEAYRELAAGRGVTRRRSDTLVPSGREGGLYALKSMDGVAPHLGFGAVRINSDIVTWPKVAGKSRRVKVPSAPGNRYVGLILLFSTTTGEPLAIVPDGIIQRLRVAATNGLGIKYLARQDAMTVGLIGSGFQAETQLAAAAALRKIDRVRLFSPTKDNRELFAREVGERLGLEIEPVTTAAEAVAGADIVLCATSSIEAVYRAEWIVPGIHISSIKRAELEAAALDRADRLILHSHDPGPMLTIASNASEDAKSAERGWDVSGKVKLDTVPLLPDLIDGKVPGRQNPDEVTAFVNNIGFGYQFAVVGALVLAAAKAAGIGHELPTEWFTETEHP